MLRLGYLVAMGCGVGACAGWAFGHFAFWTAVGLGLGWLWRHITPAGASKSFMRPVSPLSRNFWSLAFLLTLPRITPELCGASARAAPACLRIAYQRHA